MSDVEISFGCMGTTVSLMGSNPESIERARGFLTDFDRRLSRFRDDSELSLMNADPRAAVAASDLLRAAVKAALWAAELTGGLVDPTLLDALRTAGYERSMAGAPAQALEAVLEDAPRRRPARPEPRARWREVRIDDSAGVIRRPPGLQIDLGGVGKGLAADAAALLLSGCGPFAVDCGGDLRIGRTATVAPLTSRSCIP